LLLNPDAKPGILKENNIAVNIYATKRWLLTWFNEKILKKILDRNTVYDIKREELAIWKEIWLTKDWFIKVWVIKLKSKDYTSLAKDFTYIKSKYKELLEIEEIKGKIIKKWKKKKTFLEKPKEKIKGLFWKISWVFKKNKK
jgi:hypothetical protein